MTMKIKNNPSFCGKIMCDSNVSEMNCLLTKKVKNTMKVAPKGTVLYFQEGSLVGKIGFNTPANVNTPISGIYGLKIAISENDVLKVIKTGIERMKKGITKSWLKE